MGGGAGAGEGAGGGGGETTMRVVRTAETELTCRPVTPLCALTSGMKLPPLTRSSTAPAVGPPGTTITATSTRVAEMERAVTSAARTPMPMAAATAVRSASIGSLASPLAAVSRRPEADGCTVSVRATAVVLPGA